MQSFSKRKLLRLARSDCGQDMASRGTPASPSLDIEKYFDYKLSLSKDSLKFTVLCFLWIDADLLFVATQALKAHRSVCNCEQGIIRPSSDIGTGVNLRSALADEYVSG